MSTNLIVLHDYFESLEGGGRLSSILAQGLNGTLGYGFARSSHPFIENIPKTYDLKAHSTLPLWRQFKLARTFSQQTQFLADYETVIYSGFYTPLAISHHQHGQNILYCHTPPRFIYDQRDFYLQQLSPPLRPLLHAFINYLQPRYETAIAQMDVIVANSHNVQKRIKKYLNKDAVIVHPPCNTTDFKWQGQGDYYLSTARLDPLKRVDKIVNAFLKMPDKKLIVASGGTELKKLQRLANNAHNIQFTNWTDEITLQKLIGQAIATIYLPKDEDFGMSPLESQAAGKPVIGVAEGGLVETILPEKTGLLLPPDFSIDNICQAVNKMTPTYAASLRENCQQQAQKFDTALFLEKMQAVISGKF